MATTNSKRRVSILLIAAGLLLTFATVCGLYVGWMEWWTGVQSSHSQLEKRQDAHFTEPGADGSVKIAQPQQGDPPLPAEHYENGELIGVVYVPAFGDSWHRNLVEGTSLAELNKQGLGHYSTTQLPGQIGNFALAGHRNGYGQPLGDIDVLKPGDQIIIQTQKYWYVYEYTSHRIILPTDSSVLEPNPMDPSAPPTARMITMTTCEPKYQTPTHRWVAFGTFKYWAKVSDGVPEALTHKNSSGDIEFINKDFGHTNKLVELGTLRPLILMGLAIYLLIFVAAAIAFRWPALRRIHNGQAPKPPVEFYSWLWRHQPGPAVMRWVLVLILLALASASMFEWVFPWAAANIPFLSNMSNFTVG
ncbi:sortase family protein [Bifidobacterium dolichotidis]|uniref:Sortase family protein n=1 Tax=Bifidobacterium dolichotidis TaxID=2306976 RepID=A0A430FQZ8_9BIFI|nr:class E sortase [Bifidobacterium dolichotidis]RSX55234.1 sortase family protein [Bifidobacterium dolichotidis]